MRLSILPFLLAASAAIGALAEVPAVITDTSPVHSLVARVMGDLGTPGLLIPPGTSPHDAGLRPSDAAALRRAEVVVWTGPDLVPFLDSAIETLAGGAEVLTLLDTQGWEVLPLREDPQFAEVHDRGHDHGHDNGSHAHGHDDPHAWLNPAVAAVWVEEIAEVLATADPDNAATYRANAEAAIADLTALRDRLVVELASLTGRNWLVPHDAYQYFERAFALPAAGAIALSDGQSPGPAHIATLRARIAEGNITCVLSDPQTPPDLIALVLEGTAAKTVEADPDGQSLEPGPDLYPALIEGIASALQDCLS